MFHRARTFARAGVERGDGQNEIGLSHQAKCVMLKVWLDQERVQGDASHFARAAC